MCYLCNWIFLICAKKKKKELFVYFPNLRCLCRGCFCLNYYTKYDVQCHMVFYVIMVTFLITLVLNKWTNIIIDDGWVHPLAKTLPSLVNNLSWMIETWMKHHLVSDNNCNHVSHNSSKYIRGVTNNVGLIFRVGDTTPWFTVSFEQDNNNWWHWVPYLV